MNYLNPLPLNNFRINDFFERGLLDGDDTEPNLHKQTGII
jgi:hypothetical protein